MREAAGRVLRASLCCLVPQGPEWAGTLSWAHGRPNQQLWRLPTAVQRGFRFCELAPCSFIASVASISSVHLVIQYLRLKEYKQEDACFYSVRNYSLDTHLERSF